MALIPVQHVVAMNIDVDPDWDFDTNGTIEAGELVDLDANGFVRAVAVAGNRPLGIAGDNLMNAGGGTPYSASLVIGANGSGTKNTENRVSDAFNETLSSGKMTVYQGGGVFQSDQFADLSYTAGDLLYAAAGGAITNVAGAGIVAGVCLATPTAYPSGVPGTDVSGSLSLGNYIKIMLTI